MNNYLHKAKLFISFLSVVVVLMVNNAIDAANFSTIPSLHDEGAGELELISDSDTSPTITLGENIDAIIFQIGGGATTATVEWIGTENADTPPEGISILIEELNLTISGRPTQAGTYDYKVTTDGNPTAEESGTITVKLPVPYIYSATAITSEGFIAHWGDIEGETAYRINIYENGNFFTSIDDIEADQTSLAITGLNPYTTYTYTITALGDGDRIPDSDDSEHSDEIITLNSEATIYSFTIEGQISSTIGDNEISIVIPATMMRYGLKPSSIVISDYAEISPTEDAVQDFRTPVIYTVTAQDGTVKYYTVKVTNQLVASSVDNAIGYSTGTTLPSPGQSKIIGAGNSEIKYTASAELTTQMDYTILSGVTYNCLKIGNSSNADLNVYYIEGALTSASKDATILGVQIGTTSGSNTANYAVVYSSEYPFNSSAVIRGQALTSTPNTLSSMSLATATVPNNAKSFRIYRRVTTPATYGVGTSQYVFHIKTTVSSKSKLPSTPLPVPVITGASGIANSSFTAHWEDVDNEIAYTVKVYDEENNLVKTINNIAADVNSVVITGLNSNSFYSYTVTAIGEGEIYTDSDESLPSEVIRTLNTACTINEFSIEGQISAQISGTNITVVMPYGVPINNLTPTVTVFEGADYSPKGVQNFSAPVEYTVTAEDGVTEQKYTVIVTNKEPSTACEILSLSIPGQESVTFDGTDISVEMPYGVSLTNLTPTIVVSEYASYVPEGAQDFSSTLEYTVTAQDDFTEQVYTVSVSNVPPSTACNITSFSFPAQIGGTNFNGTTIAIIMPYGTDLRALSPVIELSPNATVLPSSGVSKNFSSPVEYTVTAQNGITKKQYTVVVSIEKPRIIACATETDFEVLTFTTSDVKEFEVSGTNMLDNISVSVDAPFQISADNELWGTSATLIKSGYTISAPLYVRYNPSEGSRHYGVVKIKSAQVTNGTIPVKGEVLKPTNTTDYFRSKKTGAWSVASNWESSLDNVTWQTATISPTSASTKITIRNGHVMTVDANTTSDDISIEAGAQLTIAWGYTLIVANGTAANDLIVYGTLKNSGTLTATGTVVVANGGIYEHNIPNLTIPTITWNTNATLKISGVWTNASGNTLLASLSGTTYKNIIVDCDIQGVTNYINLNSLTITGKLKIVRSGNGNVLIANSTTTFVCAAYEQTGGNIIINRQATTDRSMKVTGDAAISSGMLYLKYNASSNSLTSLGSLSVGGNVYFTGGTITNDAAIGQTVSTVSPQLIFNGTSAQTFVISSDAILGSPQNKIDVVVNNSAGVSLSNNINIYGVFQLQKGNLILGENNLTLYNPVTGTPSIASHIVTNGTGRVNTTLSSGTFLFPIGADNTHYTPVTLANNTGGIAQQYAVNVATVGTFGLFYTYQWNIAGITSSAGAGTAISLQWSSADANGFLAENPNQSILYKNEGSGWLAQGGNTSGSFVTTLNGVKNTAVSSWTIGCAEWYKSVSSGLWNGNSTWQVSYDGGQNYVPTVQSPDEYTGCIEINNTLTIPSQTNVTTHLLKLNNNGKLTVDGALTVNDSIVFVINDAQIPQLFLNSGSFVSNGYIVLRKTFRANDGWHFVSIPFEVTEANVKIAGTNTQATWGGLNDTGFDFYVAAYDGFTQNAVGVAPNYNNAGTYWQNVSDKTIRSNSGYIIRTDRDITYDFVSNENETALFGTLANVPVSAYTTNNNVEHRSWNFVGLPFTSSFNMNYVSQEHAPYYYFDGTTFEAIMAGDGYSVYPFTPIFVQRNESAINPNELVFSSEGRLVKAASSVPFDEVILVVKNTLYRDKVRIRLQSEATLNYDLGKDAVKFLTTRANVPQIYCKQNGYKLSVNAVPATTSEVSVEVMLPEAGTYTIQLEDIAKASGCEQIILLDNAVGAQVDLLSDNHSYVFEATAGAVKNLTIFFVLQGTSVVNSTSDGKIISIKTIDNKAYITGLESLAKVNIYDISGRLVQRFSEVNNNDELLLINKGIYFIDVNTSTQKAKAKVSVK